ELLLSVTAVSLTLVLCEFGLRAVDYPKPPTYGWSAPVPQSLSTRSDKDSTISILLIGDSQLFAQSRPEDPLPGKLLEKSINYRLTSSAHKLDCGTLPKLGTNNNQNSIFRVDTLGAGGWGQDQQLLSLRKIKLSQYNLILLWF